MFKFFFFVLLAAGWVIAAASLHVVRTPTNLLTVTILPKDQLTFADTYVDTRTWSANDLSKHPAFVRRVIASNKIDALSHLTDAKSQRDPATQLSDAVGRAPAPHAATKPTHPSALNAALAQLKAGTIRPEDLAKLVAATR